MPLIAETTIVDNDDGAPGYVESGSWSLSSNPGYNNGTYRFTRDTSPPSTATWTPSLPQSGVYEVYAVFRKGSDRTTSAPFTITHAEGSTVVSINMNGEFTVQEEYLGRFSFTAGTSGSVRLDNNGGSGVYIADAVRFTIAPDTPPEISELSHSPEFPNASSTVYVTARVTDESAVQSVMLHYISNPIGTSGSVPAFDDGAHQDGAAGDGVYGAAIPPQPQGAQVGYHFTAVDDSAQTTTSRVQVYVVGDTARREYRSIWADTWGTSFLNPTQAQELVQTCRDNNINTIMIEVRKIGDAYYDSSLEPRATNITGGASFDPLAYLLSLAHDTSGGKKYIEVHAWFVMQRITRGETLHPNHILSRHPEYVMSDSNGNISSGGTRYLDPGHPGAVDHNVAVILDCLSKYNIDGINLDYIRYPEASGDWGYNPVSIARFNAFYGKTGQPAVNDPDWGDWRRRCVTLAVKKVYVKSLMLKPSVVLTADTINWGFNYTSVEDFKNSSAYAGVYQDWVGWLQQGIIDYNALMNYTTTSSRYQGWTQLSLEHDTKRGSIIGIGAYLQTSVQNSMNQLLYARSQNAAGLNIYDWYSEVNATSETRAQFYQALKA